MEKSEAYQTAEKRVAAKLAFGLHLAVYLVVNGFLAAINLTTSPGYWWFLWPLAGWGIGLAIHGVSAFLAGEAARFRRRLVEEELQRELAHRGEAPQGSENPTGAG